MIKTDTYLVGINHHSFRKGVPAMIIGIKSIVPALGQEPRLCYEAIFDDGVIDYTPVNDEENYVITTMEEMLWNGVPTGKKVDSKSANITEPIILQKGDFITFLDYKISNSLNNDGLVLSKPDGKLYETHLGNFGTGTLKHINSAKKYALLHFMLARPDIFANTLANKLNEANTGTYHEYYLLANVLRTMNINMPEEITCSDNMYYMIYFNGKPLTNIIES